VNGETPLVSVIMNCYNSDRFLKEAIDSVYAQSYQNWEIIFWDNASTDQTPEIVKSYDEKLRYFRSKETTHLGKARVYATKEALGEYISFLDSDDLWLKDKLVKQVALFMNEGDNLGFVYGRSLVIFDDDKKDDFLNKEGELLPEGDIFAELAKDNFIVFSSAMVDRKKFFKSGGFPEHFLNTTDYWVFMHMAKEYKCRAIHEVCCKNRIHETNLSAKQQSIGALEAIDVLNDLLPDERVVAGLKYQYVNLAVMYIKEMKFVSVINVLIKHGGLGLLCKRVLKYYTNS
jgi:glycosyltransferase involved in cell wall biosynthesis